APPAPARPVADRAGARGSVGGGYRGLVVQGGRGGAGEFGAPDQQERDWNGGQGGEPGGPERLLEPPSDAGRGRAPPGPQGAGGGGGGGGGAGAGGGRGPPGAPRRSAGRC